MATRGVLATIAISLFLGGTSCKPRNTQVNGDVFICRKATGTGPARMRVMTVTREKLFETSPMPPQGRSFVF
jgi:hypothetical protein